MRVLVCGSRDFTNVNVITTVLQGIYEMQSIGWLLTHASHLTIIDGAASGADNLAHQWAVTPGPHPANQATDNDTMMVFSERYPPNWDLYGKRAGYVRNQQMLNDGKPELVVAFFNKPRAESKGTAMMCDIARNAGIEVWEICC